MFDNLKGKKLLVISSDINDITFVNAAKEMGYQQLELDAVAENDRAISMYSGAGFTEFGRNPMGFVSKYSGIQELVYMRLEL